jgi:pyrimidine-nucleoside phosphorylase/thymidine phosphorylase
MAILWRGMSESETAALVESMLHSGTVVDLWGIPGPRIDKHSTGGVGDKTSLILAPVAAACGVFVPMVSGRGLGHTGGTLDKLESIPGFNVQLDLHAYRNVLSSCGLVMIGQTEEIAPADRTLYALRDATATVESIPLITASILSKKLAEGIEGLVLDVKTGDGAFMETTEDARALAHSMTTIGRRLGKRITALLTRMDQPLGRAAGNAIEVEESIRTLRGDGPEDVESLSLSLAAEMLLLGDLAENLGDAIARCRNAIASGEAIERFRRMIEAQGGDPHVVDDPSRLPQPTRRRVIHAPRSGVLTRLRARPIGFATLHLGAGRARVESSVDPAAGIRLLCKEGEAITTKEPIAELLSSSVSEEAMSHAARLVEAAIQIEDESAWRGAAPLVLERL